MRIVEISWKNIGSYGNKLQTIKFDDKGKLVLLQGRTGAGKSTLLSLPSILFYGKIDKMNKSEIVNRINKNGYIKGTIVTNGVVYEIERTFSPNSINVFKDGVDVNSIGVKDAQAFIDENVVGMPFQIFCNIISLSMTKFKSFLNMNPEDRRQIIDRVFNLESVNDIFMMIKKDMRDLGLSINNHNTEVYTLTETVNKANQELTKLSQETGTKNDEKIAENNKIIDDETENVNKYNQKYSEFSNLYNNLYQDLQKNIQEYNQIEIAERVVQDKINIFNQDKCPTCQTSFSSDIFQNVKVDLMNKLQQTQEMKKKTLENRQQIVDVMNQYKTGLNTISNAISECNTKINQAKAAIYAINENIKQSSEFSSIQNIIDQNSKLLMQAKDALDKDNEKWQDLNTLSSLYSIEGVKKQVIKNYLPQLNKEIKESLLKLDFPYDLEFDENFDNHIYHLNEPISVNSISEGEHKRVDLAVLCSVFKLLKRKYPSINIFNLDEVLSSIDQITCCDILKYLRTFAEDMKLNVFVVSHVNMETELFDEQITVFKDNAFSDIEYDFKL